MLSYIIQTKRFSLRWQEESFRAKRFFVDKPLLLCYNASVMGNRGPGEAVRNASHTKEVMKQMDVIKMITEVIKLLAAVVSLIAAWMKSIKKEMTATGQG
ncbi:MAG: hypothetical protein IK099_13980 [Clostridia bacterium]|nr:hypothetical protein [Clostridia bacterium]